MAAITENDNILGTMRDRIEIPRTNLGFSTKRARRSCSQATDTTIHTGNGNVVVKTGNILIWNYDSPHKNSDSKFGDRDVCMRLPYRPTTGNGNMAAKTRNTYNLYRTATDTIDIRVFGHSELDKTVSEQFRNGRDTRKCKCNCFGANLTLSGGPSLSQSLGDTLAELVMVKNPGFVVGILTLSVIVPEIQIFPVSVAMLLFSVGL